MLRSPDTVGNDLLEARVGLLAYYFGDSDPNGALICNGRTIKYADYPLLVVHLNTIKQTGNPKADVSIPDLRGMFLRGLGGSSGKLDQTQTDAIRNITGWHAMSGESWIASSYAQGAFYYASWGRYPGSAKTDWDNCIAMFDASRVVPTANENRPVNKAYNIVIFTGSMKKKSKEFLIVFKVYTSNSFKFFTKRRCKLC